MSQDIAAAARPLTVLDEAAGERARPYAEALLNVIEAEGEPDLALDEFDELVHVLRANPLFADRLSDPSRAAAEKDRVLVETFEGRASDIVVRFLRVLNRHGRLAMIAPVVLEARRLRDRRLNRRAVEVRSAVPLDDDQKRGIVDRLAGWIGGTPVVSWNVQPNLLGGLIVKVGDQLHDASLKNRLEQYRRRIVESRSLAGTVVEA